MDKNEYFFTHYEELKTAYEECWKAKIATYDIAKMYAPLCVQIAKEHMDDLGVFPELKNQRMQQREKETDGRTPLDIDFWANEDMIIALYEEFEHDFNYTKEHYGQKASTSASP